jgi:hypothetical protein
MRTEISAIETPCRIILVAKLWRNRWAAPRLERRTRAWASARRTMWPTAAGPVRPQ